MFGSQILEVAIGVAFLFLFASLICTAAVEGLEWMLKRRASDLERGIAEMLNDREGSWLKAFYEHPLIFSLFAGDYDPKDKGNLPSYIPAANFAGAMLDLIARGTVGTTEPLQAEQAQTLSMAGLRETTEKIADPKLQRVVLSALDASGNDLNKVKLSLEAWFDGTMDRVSGWYKRRTQAYLFGIGLATAVTLNIDAITVAERLSQDTKLREAIVAEASAVQAGTRPERSVFQLRDELNELGYPIGWKDWWPEPQTKTCTAVKVCENRLSLGTVVKMIVGWFITALAIMLGAPFWFDVLNKIMVIRSTVKPHEKSLEEGSEDRASGRRGEPLTPPPAGSAAASDKP